MHSMLHVALVCDKGIHMAIWDHVGSCVLSYSLKFSDLAFFTLRPLPQVLCHQRCPSGLIPRDIGAKTFASCFKSKVMWDKDRHFEILE